MSASIFGAAFDRLPIETQLGITESLRARKNAYLAALRGERWRVKAILVGDRPGNGARLLPADHHHTPFHSTKNSSLWLNRQLVEAKIDETQLVWLNAANMHGAPFPVELARGWLGDPLVVALGGNAERWLKGGGIECIKVYHPQAWKRFHSKQEYPLIPLLRKTLDLQK
jgi:hypothetical protein